MQDKYYSEGILLLILVHICRWSVGILFIVAAIPKILDAESFMRVVANYNLLPLFLVPSTAIVLPWLELSCGVCLLMKKCVQSASAVLAVLIIAFIGGLTINYFRGADFDCGCFGILFRGGSLGVMTIVRDVFLLGLTAFVLLLSGSKNTPALGNKE